MLCFQKNILMKKKEIINLLVNLTELKYGDVFSDPAYQSLKDRKLFYKARMDFVEQIYNGVNSLSVEEVKTKLKEKLR